MSPEQPARPPWRRRLMAFFWAWLLRLQAATWRLHVEGLDTVDASIAEGRPLLAVFWHGKYIPLFALLRGRRAMIFSSRSPRGEIIAEICRRFGYACTLLADRGGDRSLDLMKQSLEGVVVGALAVDGPMGPYHDVKRGSIMLAAEQGRVIFPVAIASSRNRITEGRWDRLETPRLFASVALVVGPSLEIPKDLKSDQIGAWQERLHQALNAADARAKALITDPALRWRAPA